MIPRRSKKSEMQSNNSNNDEEVDWMLQAAQDELLLKLSVDSHTTRLSADQLLPDDLDRRFLALKSQRPKSHPPPRQSSSPSIHKPQDDSDLFARFAALKGSGSGSGSGVSSSSSGAGVGAGVDEDNDEDEVEKIIRWAKDAARLDPSPPSDDDDGDDKEDNSSNDEEDDSSDDEKDGARTMGRRR